MTTSFGFTKGGKETFLYTKENNEIIMKVTDYGATLVSFIDKKTGKDIVEGFDSVEEYIAQDCYIGASIGRTANRIEKGIFTLNGKEYSAPINNNGNCNHGGLEGFDKKVWDTEETDDSVTFTYISVDGEEGYPGTLTVKVKYQLIDRGISISTEATTDADTLFAYTNHSYFNLEESEDATNHTLKIDTDLYGLSDANGLTLNALVPVEGTPFDFRKEKLISEDINADNEQITFGAGYDHHYPITGEGMRKMAELSCNGLKLTLASDYPGFHLYTANWLSGQIGKKGHVYARRSSVCLEAEYMPNAINYPNVNPKPIVKTGETQKHEIRYTLSDAE